MRQAISALLLLGLTATLAHGQIPEGVEGTYEPHPEANEAIGQLLSPYCPGLMLEQCPAAESRALRDSIHALAVQGWTAGEIRGWVLANHGEEWKAVPDRSGAGLWAWLLPPLALLAGLVVVVNVVRRWSGPSTDELGEPEEAAWQGPSAEEESRLREALRELELSEDPAL
jgi:cytochrome c-type biogenesis protein CcmH/NrfF